jgi:histidinol-phosphate/aromatic aminotransferase/cobyric acid decarboxylase-like protein
MACLRTHPALVVLRTLSKAYGLAGARCGALLAQPEVIALLRKVIQPYAVTQLSIEVVFRTLQPAHLALAAQRVAEVMAERARLASALAALRGTLRVWPSAANFLLVDFAEPARALQRARAAGLLLRDVRAHPALSAALRISVGSRAQNDQLLASLS